MIILNPNAKFRDNSGTLAQARQEALIRDCPSHSGTVGNYVIAEIRIVHIQATICL